MFSPVAAMGSFLWTYTVRPHLSAHTSVLDEIADKVRELDKRGSSSIVYSRIIADSFQ